MVKAEIIERPNRFEEMTARRQARERTTELSIILAGAMKKFKKELSGKE
jgi:hypothetical protein